MTDKTFVIIEKKTLIIYNHTISPKKDEPKSN
jgi:hypothetical protein